MDISSNIRGNLHLFDITKDYRKFISTQPGHKVGFPNMLQQTVSHGNEDTIANLMAMLVVDILESVQIDVQECKHSCRPFTLCYNPFQGIEKEPSIGETCQCVVIRILFQLQCHFLQAS